MIRTDVQAIAVVSPGDKRFAISHASVLMATGNESVPAPMTIWEGIRKGTQERMNASRQSLEEAGVAEVEEIVSESLRPAEAIAKYANELDADLVVMATHGRAGLKHSFIGSITERALRTSPVPVLAVKDSGGELVPVRRILVPTDFSPPSEEAIRIACSLAERFGAAVDVLYVLDEWPGYLQFASAEAIDFETRARAVMGDRLETLKAEISRSNLPVKAHLRKGIAADVIVDEADRLGADLIVMGTHGHRGMAHLTLGSVTERSLRMAPCSVLTTHAAPEESSGAG
jgi:nucleotide-binding universal stress UspA family protein